MAPIRSILWIGRGGELGCGIVADTPSVDVAWARNLDDALGLPIGTFDVAVLDAEAPTAALADVRRLRRMRGAPALLVRMDTDEARCIPDLLAAGAAEVVLRGPDEAAPDARDDLVSRIEKLAAAAPFPPRSGSAPDTAGIVGESRALRAAFELAECAATSRATVLITGETGTGKELLARAVHSLSPRSEKPFIAVNCAAFPESLLESELFGHVRGAFTGADREKRGLFEVADGGTLFLDEIGETSPPLQAKLLRVLQEREVRPVGGSKTRKVDVRVLAATNRNLRREVEEGHFREDLYYRLAVFPIEVPALRERPEDVMPLARHFLTMHARRDAKHGLRFARDTEHLLQVWSWPGNVRELENEIQRLVALAEPDETLGPARLSPRLLGAIPPELSETRPGETLKAQMDRVEAWMVRRALDEHGGRRTRTANRLGLTREGLYKKMKRLGIE